MGKKMLVVDYIQVYLSFLKYINIVILKRLFILLCAFIEKAEERHQFWFVVRLPI